MWLIESMDLINGIILPLITIGLRINECKYFRNLCTLCVLWLY
jgi:hypothetical protein